MAKQKKQASKPSAAKSRKPAAKTAKTAKAAKKPAKKPASKQHRHEHHHDEAADVVEIELSENEQSMVDKILDSNELCEALEAEAIAALSTVVQKFFRKHGSSLTADQAQNVAMVLFGD